MTSKRNLGMCRVRIPSFYNHLSILHLNLLNLIRQFHLHLLQSRNRIHSCKSLSVFAILYDPESASLLPVIRELHPRIILLRKRPFLLHKRKRKVMFFHFYLQFLTIQRSNKPFTCHRVQSETSAQKQHILII